MQPMKKLLSICIEITENPYAFTAAELARIFINMKEQGAIQRGKLLKAAHERSIRSEMALIYDVNQMNPSAIKMADLVREGSE